jgi:hypothetical protein
LSFATASAVPFLAAFVATFGRRRRRADTAMFWSLGHFSSPSIDTILDREDGFTLEDLLEEDELLQECKAQNAKLTEL